eukprot:scaffold305224_cov31-Tisochrysis_lutea.AAC.3
MRLTRSALRLIARPGFGASATIFFTRYTTEAGVRPGISMSKGCSPSVSCCFSKQSSASLQIRRTSLGGREAGAAASSPPPETLSLTLVVCALFFALARGGRLAALDDGVFSTASAYQCSSPEPRGPPGQLRVLVVGCPLQQLGVVVVEEDDARHPRPLFVHANPRDAHRDPSSEDFVAHVGVVAGPECGVPYDRCGRRSGPQGPYIVLLAERRSVGLFGLRESEKLYESAATFGQGGENSVVECVSKLVLLVVVRAHELHLKSHPGAE